MRYVSYVLLWFSFQAGLGFGAGPSIDPKVKEEIAKLAEYLSQSETVSFRAEVTNIDVSSTLQRLHYETSVRGAIQRPNRVFLEKTGAENTTLWFSGTEAVILDRDTDKFVRIPVSGNIRALVEKLEALKIETPFGGLLRADLPKQVEANVFRGDGYGRALIEGVDCSHLALRQDSIDWQVWIASDGAPKKLVITSKMLTGMPEHQIVFRDVKRNLPIEGSLFMPSLPKTATEVPVAGGGR